MSNFFDGLQELAIDVKDMQIKLEAYNKLSIYDKILRYTSGLNSRIMQLEREYLFLNGKVIFIIKRDLQDLYELVDSFTNYNNKDILIKEVNENHTKPYNDLSILDKILFTITDLETDIKQLKHKNSNLTFQMKQKLNHINELVELLKIERTF